MLKSLQIQNYALIRHLEISPSTRLNIITGETGAGKSIMIGAVGLLLGNRADTKVLYDKDKKCIIEGAFRIGEYELSVFFHENDLDYSDETIIRREISPSGKSRAFINDTPVTLDIMKSLGTHLMDIHSQHDTYKLSSLNYQLSLIDVFARNQDIIIQYQQAYDAYSEQKKALKALREEAKMIRKEADYNHFLYEELKAADLKPEELTLLENELSALEHAEEIKTGLLEAIQILQNADFSVLENLSNINKKFETLSKYARLMGTLNERINSSYLELKDIVQEIERESEKVENNPGKLEEVQQRVNLINKLLQKHQLNSVSELIAIQLELEQKVNKNLNLDEDIRKLNELTEKNHREVLAWGARLSDSRLGCFDKISGRIEEMLGALGIPNARLVIEHEETPPTASGMDEIVLKFSANKGITPQPLRQVASGGEFSRLMFCIKYIIASKTALPTLILDEIDTGISGEIAMKMAAMMKNMSLNHQVIAITHLPQIASSGEAHYFVYKEDASEKSVSLVRKLGYDDRVREIAKMIGGDTPTEAAFVNARELLGKSGIN